MRPPNADTQHNLEKLQSEMNMVLATIGQEKISDAARKQAHDRLAELTSQIVSISKRGDTPEYIVNLTDKKWLVNRCYASYLIKGREPGEQYSVTKIEGRPAYLDTGRGGEASVADRGWRVKLDNLYVTASQIAADVVREINGDLPAIISGRTARGGKITKTMGVFISHTPRPQQDVLNTALLELKTYFSALVADGNATWSKTKDYRQISDLCRDAAEYLGISTEWHMLLNTEQCPGCGAQVVPGIAVHPACGAILDHALAEKLGILASTAPVEHRKTA